ncbi:hypothetical protein VWX97_07125 [Phaeobacter sp. JH18-32]|uniref:hypothetical protein n=1 Tax=Phaeobacter TaxID=302485 RepID=UPI003A852C68
MVYFLFNPFALSLLRTLLAVLLSGLAALILLSMLTQPARAGGAQALDPAPVGSVAPFARPAAPGS